MFRNFEWWWHIFRLSCPFYHNIISIYWIMSVSKFWTMVTYLSFELPLLSQYNYDRLNHVCFNCFIHGDIFINWVITIIIVIIFSFWCAFGYLPIVRGFQWRIWLGRTSIIVSNDTHHWLIIRKREVSSTLTNRGVYNTSKTSVRWHTSALQWISMLIMLWCYLLNLIQVLISKT